MTLEEILVLCMWGVLPLTLIIGCCIFTWIDYAKEKKYKKKYPELFELIEKRNELQSKSSKFYFDNISPKMDRIDYIIKEQKYMSAKTLEQSHIELEELRTEVEKLKEEHNELCKEELVLFEIIESIIKSDKGLFKFMKSRGWCRD